MVEEVYVNFETAKLLKEKGFNEGCSTTYTPNGFFHTHNYRPLLGDIFAPTQQMAMAWLREEYKLFIEIRVGINDDEIWYDFDVLPLDDRHINPIDEMNEFDTYEEAVETAIQYCLTNLV